MSIIEIKISTLKDIVEIRKAYVC